MNIRNILSGKKTYLTAIIAILGTLLGYVEGQVELVPALQTVVGSLLASFLRSGINSNK
jgi:hypothetical protein